MGKRLDVQSLLEKCSKSEIDQFLRLRFAKNKVLESDFLVHFAAAFDLDDQHLKQIIRRVERIFPKSLSKITVKKANKGHEYISNLIEQARDCIYAKNYNQSYLLLSNLTPLLDRIVPEIPHKYDFDPFLGEVYRLFLLLYEESPARPLKTKIEKHMQSMMTEHDGIITDRQYNPYVLICSMNPKNYSNESFDLLEEKLRTEPGRKQNWVGTYIDLLIEHSEWQRLDNTLKSGIPGVYLYRSLLVHSDVITFPDHIVHTLKDNF